MSSDVATDAGRGGETAISVEGVTKVYRTGTLFPRVHDYLRSETKNPVAFYRAYRRGRAFKALDDVSFAVRRGEVVGIVGQNGSGKSTTLKLLSRITAPDAGAIECSGRVSALIEVGAGFNGELTGRENVYLNGAILGIPTREIARRFDRIVAFAELERFIDTPVKWYSSGMYVRLGFSVAMELDPDVLLVDEVLAVGDAAFRAKCMDRMLAFAEDRRVTILFVSHNLRAVSSICHRVIWLDAGRVRADGPADQVLDRYMDFLSGKEREGRAVPAETVPGFTVTRMRILDRDGTERYEFARDEPVRLHLAYRAERRFERPHVTFAILNRDGYVAVASNLLDDRRPDFLEGEGVLEVEFERLDLMPGTYRTVGSIHQADGVAHVARSFPMPGFTVTDPPEAYGWTSRFATPMAAEAGCRAASYRWTFKTGS